MQWFRKSMIWKTFFVYSVVILLICSMCVFYLNMQVTDYFEKEQKEQLFKDAGQIETEIEMFMQKYMIIAAQMETNIDFINITKEVKDRYKKREHPLYNRVTEQLKGIISLDENIALSYIAIDQANDLITNQDNYEIKPNFNMKKREWYKQAVQEKKVTVTSPYVDVVTNNMVVSIASPLMEDGEILGVFALDLMVDDIYHMMKTHSIGKEGYAILVDKDGSILYHPDYENIKLSERIFLHEELGEISKKLISGQSGITKYNENGKEYYIAYMPIENVDWTVVTILPKLEVFAPLESLISKNILILAGMIIVMILLLSLLQYSISKPILKISREIEEKNQLLSEEIRNRIQIQTRLEMILQLLSKTDEGIFIVDEKDFCVYCNYALEKIIGYKQEELKNIGLIKNIISFEKNILEEITQNRQASGEIQYINTKDEAYFLFLKIDKVQYDGKDYYIGSVMDRTKYKEREKDVYFLKYFDSLTKLKSKAYFEEYVTSLIHKENFENLMYALIIINLDDFRLINEAKGFEFGNKVLMELSKKLKNFEGEKDCLARMGNDEFALLKANIKSNDELYRFISSLDEEINSEYYIESEEVFINASIGIGICPKDADNYDVLLKSATSALNSAKRSKENQFEFYNNEINKQSLYKYELQNQLRNALLHDEFVLHYQPQIDMSTQKIIGMEALIRWKPSGTQNNIMPDVFIPLSEESNLIVPIGEWVLFEACRFGHELYSKGFEITIGVNLSRVQFKDPYITTLIHSILEETKFPSSLLELEITEGILMENQEECETILNELKKMGVKITIDDFGTGYSSLSYLQNFAVDKIKIDRSFIKEIPQYDNGVIAKVIIELAENLNLGVIAEGVETKEQVDFLMKNKCKEAQGFLYAKPLNKEDLLRYLKIT